ncbi:MOS1T transposase, partial [Pseudoatta argentina]
MHPEKRPLYAQRHDKVILLHDNARPHVAKPVKTYLETLKWEVLPNPLYSPDIAPSDFHLFRDDRRLTVDELSAMFPQISRSLLHEIITEALGYRKLSARWVPKQLTDQHKLNRVEAGQEFLRRYKLHGDEFFRSIVTGDETWVEKSFQPTRR